MTSRVNLLAIALLAIASLVACSDAAAVSDNLEVESVRASSFELVDTTGNVRAELSMEEGSPRFVFNDADGIPRFEVKTDSAGNPALTLLDEHSVRRTGFEFANGENPALFIRDDSGQLKAGLQVQTDGNPVLLLRNSALEDGFAVTVLEEDLPVMALGDPTGRKRLFLGLEPSTYSGSMVFINENSSVEQSIPYPVQPTEQ